MSKPSSKALVTLTNLKTGPQPEDGKLAGPANLEQLCARANEQYAAIRDSDRSNSLRGVFLGVLFWQIKNECGHGQFMKIASERMRDIPVRTRNELMKLALTFVERTKLALPERFNIPDAQLALTLDDARGTEKEMVTRALSFIGELSLHELMIKHGIRAVGLKKDLTEEASEADDSNLPVEEQIRRRREQLFGGSIEHLNFLHKTLTVTENLTLLDNTQLEAIETKLVELRAAIVAVRKTA